jgi:hypothetical protein
VIFPDLSSHSPSISSAMRTPDPQSSVPSTPVAETDKSPVNTEGDPVAPEPAVEEDIQMEYSSD